MSTIKVKEEIQGASEFSSNIYSQDNFGYDKELYLKSHLKLKDVLLRAAGAAESEHSDNKIPELQAGEVEFTLLSYLSSSSAENAKSLTKIKKQVEEVPNNHLVNNQSEKELKRKKR
eukprot:GHVP01038183.1.p1 GENE.GHVP01038183.1~~GHVP01038183.1.p1  ORF type:complete len:117 (-),score=30.39 GHVP01038183.1:629-979(-)